MLSRNSISSDCRDLLEMARARFEDGEPATAETLLGQIILLNNRIPEVFVMLGTIYYDQGKFSKAIKTYRRALEIDPNFADASVGLAMLLNDLGRYEEAKQVFEEAEHAAEALKRKADPMVEKRLFSKHIELGDLYFQSGRYDEALEDYMRALAYAPDSTELKMKIVDCLVSKSDSAGALLELKTIIRDHPSFVPARIRLGKLLYGNRQVADAVEEWEAALALDPGNAEIRNHLKVAQKTRETELSL